MDTLQQMIEETEDTDAEDEIYEEIIEDDHVEMLDDEDVKEFVLPSVDEESNADLNEIVDYFSDSNKSSGDIMFTKPKNEAEAGGFKLNVDKIASYGVAEEIAEDEEDEFDEVFDDNKGGDDLASKFKSFFKK